MSHLQRLGGGGGDVTEHRIFPLDDECILINDSSNGGGVDMERLCRADAAEIIVKGAAAAAAAAAAVKALLVVGLGAFSGLTSIMVRRSFALY